MDYFAHSKNEKGAYHLLSEHLKAVAEKATEYMIEGRLRNIAYFAGLWHDLGKIHPDFQNKLVNNISDYVDHKGFGFFLAKKYASEILQYTISGHHGGLSNPEDINSWAKEIWGRGDIKHVLKEALDLVKGINRPPEDFLPIEGSLSQRKDLLIRIVFSALVDADFLDTEKHFDSTVASYRVSKTINKEHWKQFQTYHKNISTGKKSNLNQLRQHIYQSCVSSAEKEPGFFRLTVPTGGGKTLSSLGFAIKHALKHNKQRVIYAIPYTSIIEQTVSVFKSIFPSQTVLEHHTGIHTKENYDYNDRDIWNRIASENWDAPIIITTTVQLFESLVARSTSKCRKLHNIQNSVIIIDEAQTLPMELLPTIMDLLKELVQHYLVTVVFCTATQPALDLFLKPSGIKPVELAPDPPILFKQLKRVRYRNHSNEKWDWQKIIYEMKKVKRAMAIVNTKKDARELWEAFGEDSVYHLSAVLCGAHRRDILNEIREKLENKETCYLISTQVVEAGVDVDFDRVLRAIGPLDRIVQAAGRCNREGKLKYGEVFIVNPEKGSFPKGIYGVSLHKAGQLLNNPKINLDLNDPDTFPTYFTAVRENITERLDIEEYRDKLKFKTIAEKFKMITEETLPVIVKYHAEKVQKLIDNLQYSPRNAIRELQPYLVNLYPWEIKKYSSMVKEIFPGLFIWEGRYHQRLGLLKEIDLKGLIY